jgi:citrate lyase beta subunit
VFPKLDSLQDFETTFEVFKNRDIKIILLVETPLLFLQVQEVLLKYKPYFSGIGIGSHDFMSVIGGVHTMENIEYIRQHILYLARAFEITAIDIASMELKNEALFEAEIIDGFQKGYDAKFFIHPWQVQVYDDINFYDAEEYEWALQIQEELENVGNQNEFNPIVINGQIIERPHLNRMKKILKYYKI